MAAAHTVSSVAANAANLFTHSGGIQAIAGNGPVSLQAHTDQLEILADQAVTVISVNDSIEIKAKEKIVLQAGQSSITLEGGNITFACPGKFTVKGGQHLFDAGTHNPLKLTRLPDTRPDLFDEQFHFVLPGTDIPITNTPYRITASTGEVFEGVTDAQGFTERVRTDSAAHLTVEIFDSEAEHIIGDDHV
jgi:type VI secretion system secreted protein VgrG